MSTAARRRPLAEAGLLALAAFAAASVGAGLARAVTTTYLPVLLEQIRSAPGLIGTVMLVNPIAGAAGPLVVGLWSDRLRARGRSARIPFVLGGSIVTAGGMAAAAFGEGTTYVLLAGAGLLAYLGINAVQTAHRTLVAECFTAERRPQANGAQELALLVGSLAGVAVGGAAVELEAWLPFALAAVAAPLLALPTLMLVRDPRRASAASGERRPFGYYVRAAARPGIRAFFAAEVLWVTGYVALPPFFILYARDVLELGASTASLWLVGFGLATGLAILVGGRLTDPSRQAPLVALGLALMGGGFLLVAFTDQLLLVAMGLLPAAIGFGLISALAFPILAALVPAGEEGAYSALFHSVRAIAAAVALPAAGWTISLAGTFRALFVFGGLVTLASLVPLLRACWVGARTVPERQLPMALGSGGWWLRWFGALGAVWGSVLGFGLLVVTTPLHELDEWLFLRINGLGYGPDLLWVVLNPHVRNYLVLHVLAFLVALAVRPRLSLHVPALVVLAFGLAIFLMESMYWVWARDRPEETLGRAVILDGNSWAPFESYPSGHAGATTAVVAAMTFGFSRLGISRWLAAPLWLYLAAVLFTRVQFGAHFPFDLLAGTVVGYASARLVLELMETIGAFAAPLPRLHLSSAARTRSRSRRGRKELSSPS